MGPGVGWKLPGGRCKLRRWLTQGWRARDGCPRNGCPVDKPPSPRGPAPPPILSPPPRPPHGLWGSAAPESLASVCVVCVCECVCVCVWGGGGGYERRSRGATWKAQEGHDMRVCQVAWPPLPPLPT